MRKLLILIMIVGLLSAVLAQRIKSSSDQSPVLFLGTSADSPVELDILAPAEPEPTPVIHDAPVAEVTAEPIAPLDDAPARSNVTTPGPQAEVVVGPAAEGALDVPAEGMSDGPADGSGVPPAETMDTPAETQPTAVTMSLPVDTAQDSLGEQRVAVILIDYQNDGNEQPADWYRDAVFGPENSIDRFIRESSYGKAWLSGEVFGWYHVSGDPPWLRQSPYYPAREGIFEAADGDIDYSEYDRFLFIYRCYLGEVGGSWGRSAFGRSVVTTPDGPVRASISEIRASDLAYPHTDVSRTHSMVTTHELVHALGIPGHANAYECGDESITSDTSQCKQLARGDAFDIMGGRYWSSQPNGAYKEQLGWLAEENIVSVDETGTYAVYSLEEPSSATQVVKIPLPNPIPVSTVTGSGDVFISHYYLEFRTASGFDERLDGLAAGRYLAPGPTDTDGLMVRGAFFNDGKCTTTYLLDMTPGSLDGTSSADNDFIDSVLTPGAVFYDELNRIRIEPTRLLPGGGIEVRITMGA